MVLDRSVTHWLVPSHFKLFISGVSISGFWLIGCLFCYLMKKVARGWGFSDEVFLFYSQGQRSLSPALGATEVSTCYELRMNRSNCLSHACFSVGGKAC